MRADFAAAFARRTSRRVGRRARPGRHVRVGGRDRARARAGRALPGAPVFTTANAAGHGDFEQVGWVLAGMDRAQPGPTVRDATVTDTDALLGEVGYSAVEIAALREEGVAA